MKIGWWVTSVRKNSNKLPQIKTLWESFSWDIATRMRQTETFNTITDELMADLSTVNDALMQSPKEEDQDRQRRAGALQGQQGQRQGQRIQRKRKGLQGVDTAIQPTIQRTDMAHTVADATHTSCLPTTPTNIPAAQHHATTSYDMVATAHQDVATTTWQGPTLGTVGPVPGADPTKNSNCPTDLTTEVTGSGGQQRVRHLAQKFFHDTSVVRLSFFDGIGAASLAFLNLGIQPVLTMSWEIDTECIAVLDEHFAPIHMGDIATFNIEAFRSWTTSTTTSQ